MFDFFSNINPSYWEGIWIWPSWEKLDLKKALIAFPAVFYGIPNDHPHHHHSHISIAFTFHYNFYPVQRVLKNPTAKRMIQTSMIGVTFPLVVYLIVAISAYIEYKVVNPNILLTLDPNNTGRVLFCFLYGAFSLKKENRTTYSKN